MQNNFQSLSNGGHADSHTHSAAADLPPAAKPEQQLGGTRAGVYTTYGGGLAGHMQLAGPTSDDSPAVSEVMVLDAPNPQQRIQYRCQSPSPDGEGDFGQYTSDSAAAQHTAARQHTGQGMNAVGPGSSDTAAADADAAPTSLPPPAFDLIQQPAAPRSGSGQDREAFVQQLHMQLQSSLQAAAAQDPSTGQHGSAQPQHSQAGFHAAPARRDHASELTQLLSALPTDEVLACLRQLKAGNSPDSRGPLQGRHQSPPAPQQQQQQPLQQQQAQEVRQHGLPPSAASAPNVGGYQQVMPLLPPTLSAPVGPSSQNQGLAAALADAASAAPWVQQEDPGADMQSGPLGPYRQQQRLAPPRFIPEAHHGSSMQGTPLAEQLQRILQQPAQPPMQQQRLLEPSFTAAPAAQYEQRQQQQQQQPDPQGIGSYQQQQQSLQLPQQQQQQQPRGYQGARPAHLQVPAAPAQPAMLPSAADILQIMQRLVGASQGGNGGKEELQAPSPPAPAVPAPPPPAAAATGPGLQQGNSVFEVALQGIAQALHSSLGSPAPAPMGSRMGGTASSGFGPPPPAPAPPAAAPPPPAPVRRSGVDIDALMQQLLSGKQQQQQQPMQALQAVVPAPPAAAAGLGLGLSGLGDAFSAVVASAVAGITEGFSNGQGPTSPGSRRLIEAANNLLAALNAAQEDPAAAAGGTYLQEAAEFDPVAAAAAPRDYVPVKQQQQHSGSGHPGEWPAAGYGAGEGEGRGWGRSSHAGGRNEGSTYGHEQAYTAGGAKHSSLPGRRKGRGRSARGKASALSHGNNNLFALLAALEQQESQDFAATADNDYDHGDEGYSYETASAAEPGVWDGGDSEQERVQSSAGGEAPAGYAGGQQAWQGRKGPKAERQKRHMAAMLAAALKVRRRRHGGPVDPEPGINVLTTDQRWLLQQREGGKRAVKPNETFSAYVAPVLPHEMNAQHKRGRPRKASHGDGNGLGYNPDDAAAMAAMPSTFIDGPNHPRRQLKTPRTSYGWYLLVKGRLQEERGEVDAAAAEAGDQHAAARQCSAQQKQQREGGEGDVAQLSGSSGAVVARAGSSQVVSASAAAGGGEPVAFESLSEAAMAAAAAEAALQEQDAKQARYESGLGEVDMTDGNVSTAAAAAPSFGPARVGRRWCWVAGDSQWVTPDGVTVWPRDNEVTAEQRVFYVAYKWVHQYWPHRVGRGDPHIVTLPAALWVEGQPQDVVLSAKLRMYNKAAHMLLTPYSSLAQDYAGLWFTGYGYDARNKVIRCYLSYNRPEQQAKPGVAAHKGRGRAKPRSGTKTIAGAPSVAGAPAAGGEAGIMSESIAAPGPKQEAMDAFMTDTSAAAAAGMPAAAAAASALAAGSGVVQQRNAGSSLSGRKRRKQQGPAVVGSVPAGVPMEAVAHADYTAGAPVAAAAAAGGEDTVTPTAAAVTAAAEKLGGFKPDLKAFIARPAAVQPATVGDQRQQQQPALKRARPSRSAAAGVAAAAVAAGAGRSPRSGAMQEEVDPAVLKYLARSANGRAAVAKRWAKYRQEKGQNAVVALQVQAAPAGPRAAAALGEVARTQEQQQQGSPQTQKPPLRLPELGGREFAADIGTISIALLSVSDSMKLPEELVVGLSRQLVKALQDAAAAVTVTGCGCGSAGGKKGADTPTAAGGAGGVKDDWEGGMQLHAHVKGWYGQLCGAVSERNGALVAQLVEDLGSKVLAPAS